MQTLDHARTDSALGIGQADVLKRFLNGVVEFVHGDCGGVDALLAICRHIRLEFDRDVQVLGVNVVGGDVVHLAEAARVGVVGLDGLARELNPQKHLGEDVTDGQFCQLLVRLECAQGGQRRQVQRSIGGLGGDLAALQDRRHGTLRERGPDLF